MGPTVGQAGEAKPWGWEVWGGHGKGCLLAAKFQFQVRSLRHLGKHLEGEGLRPETGPLWAPKAPEQQECPKPQMALVQLDGVWKKGLSQEAGTREDPGF